MEKKKWEAGLCSQTAQQAANERAPLPRNEECMRGGGTAIGRARGVTGAPEQCGSAKSLARTVTSGSRPCVFVSIW